MMRLALALLALAAPPALAATAGDFGAFWKAFAAAAGKDDQAALARMTILGPGLDPNLSPPTFAAFHAAHLGPTARRCLTRATPVRDEGGDGVVTYDVFCGQVIYSFSWTAAGWKLTDMGVND
jgi:hypothetical protein